MFCYQCEQTAHGSGCVTSGVCGKSPEVSDLQDVLIHVAQGVALAAGALERSAVASFLEDALFATVTNVNFDASDIETRISQGAALLDQARRYSDGPTLAGPALFTCPTDRAGLLALAKSLSIDARRARLGAELCGLQELLAYGLKGMAAYAHHARALGRASAAVEDFLIEGLAFLADPHPTRDALLAMALRCGGVSLQVMELLDDANTGRFGHPTPTAVPLGHRAGKAILVSGHDLDDLARLLEQTAGTGIRIYTHGEMLPAHGYPKLREHPHLAGHFGGAWQDQLRDFATFPGAIVMTTNCLMPPRPSYRDRLFTTGVVGFPGLPHVGNDDFAPVIAAALAAPGFAENLDAGTHTVGFHRDAVSRVAGTVLDAIKSGALRHILLIGGCDAATQGRDYYSALAAQAPDDWIVLTLGCGKYRVIDQVKGTVGGLPRLLDLGQCNDAYSAIAVAGTLAQALGVGLNDLPLSLVLSWFEQKAVTVLLALLHLGLRDIRIGPSLPAFIGPEALKVLVDTFALKPIGTVAGDLAAITA